MAVIETINAALAQLVRDRAALDDSYPEQAEATSNLAVAQHAKDVADNAVVSGETRLASDRAALDTLIDTLIHGGPPLPPLVADLVLSLNGSIVTADASGSTGAGPLTFGFFFTDYIGAHLDTLGREPERGSDVPPQGPTAQCEYDGSLKQVGVCSCTVNVGDSSGAAVATAIVQFSLETGELVLSD